MKKREKVFDEIRGWKRPRNENINAPFARRHKTVCCQHPRLHPEHLRRNPVCTQTADCMNLRGSVLLLSVPEDMKDLRARMLSSKSAVRKEGLSRDTSVPFEFTSVVRSPLSQSNFGASSIACTHRRCFCRSKVGNRIHEQDTRCCP